MKKAPIQILLIIMITSIICIASELVLLRQLDEIQAIHEEIMEESIANREYMSAIRSGLYEHQAILANYALSNSEMMKMVYANREEKLREEVAEKIIEFSYRMKVGERERIYHRVYSEFSGYDTNTSLFMKFIQNDERDMAIYYNDNVLKNYLDKINTKLKILDNLIVSEVNLSEYHMEKMMRSFQLLRVIIMAMVILFMGVCISICFRITSGLDKYKEELEKELIEKNKVLQQHNERMLKLQDDIIYSMANLIESRDNETGEHVKRTSTYVAMTARAAKAQGVYADVLTEDYIERLIKVAPLHDVGKIAVPDHILLKPGKLTEEEFEKIKLHASRGKAIIQDLFGKIEDKEYLEMAGDVAGYHHERWNGEGYAAQLAEEDIPLAARIMAIADVFDALVSKRRYKDAFSLDVAFDIIEKSGGSHFDPALTKVFLSIRKEIEEYLNTEELEEKIM